MQGKYTVLMIFLLAGGMAGFAWWVNYQRAAHCREYWNEDYASAIRFAKTVNVYELANVAEANWKNSIRSVNVSSLPGFLHARTSLLQDASYDWSAKSEQSQNAKYVLVFTHNAQDFPIYFGQGVSKEQHGNNYLTFATKTESGWQIFMKRHFPDDAPETTPIAKP
jgi:hypothetical protein